MCTSCYVWSCNNKCLIKPQERIGYHALLPPQLYYPICFRTTGVYWWKQLVTGNKLGLSTHFSYIYLFFTPKLFNFSLLSPHKIYTKLRSVILIIFYIYLHQHTTCISVYYYSSSSISLSVWILDQTIWVSSLIWICEYECMVPPDPLYML